MKDHFFRALFVLTLCILTATLFMTVAGATVVDSGYCGGEDDGTNLTWIYTDDGTLTISGSGAMKNFNDSGAAPWKNYRSSISKIVLSPGITTIGKYSFYKCSAITSITIPNTVSELGYYAFYSCTNLKHITLPSSVSSLAYYVFSYCTSLETAAIPSSVTSIGKETFRGCTSLKSVTFDATVSTLSQYTFSECTSLTSVVLSDSIEYIDAWAFKGCSSLKTINLPSNTKTIGQSAFSDCTALCNLSLPDNLKEIHDFAFSKCTSLYSIEIPKSVNSIGDYAFSNCTALVNVVLNEGTERLGSNAFSKCASLARINFPESVQNIGSNTFSNCTNLSFVKLGSQVEFVGEGAFSSCSSLAKFINPSPNTQITTNLIATSHVFNNCPLLVSAGPIGSGCTIEYGWTDSIPSHAFCGTTALEELIFPETLTSIGQYAFTGCDRIASVFLPKSLKKLDYQVFSQCANLTDAYFYGDAPDGSKYIFPNDITIHYIPTTSGWTTPTWNGYSTVIWSGTPAMKEKVSVPSGQYCLRVVDENGNPIEDVKVTFDSFSTTTNKDGHALFSVITMGNPVITASKSGYLTWSNNNTNWSRNEDRYDTIILYPTGYGEYKLQSARYSNFSDYSHSVDLLTRTKKIGIKGDNQFIGSLDFGEFYLSCQAYSTNDVTRYELWQGQKLIAVSTDGNFKLSSEDFEAGGNCTVHVVNKKQQKVPTRINLEFVETAANKTTKLSILSDKITFAISPDVPYLGGNTFEVKLPLESDYQFHISDDGKILIGMNLIENENKPEESIEKAKNLLSELIRDNGNPSYYTRVHYQDLIKDKKSFKIGMLSDVEVNFFGYIEADLGSTQGTGQLLLEIKYPLFKGEFNTMVYMVPVTAHYNLDLEGKLTATVGYNFREARLVGDLHIKPGAKLSAFAGAGVSRTFGAGVYGSATLNFDICVVGRPIGLQEVSLTGDLGLKAYLFNMEYKRSFAYNTWYLWSNNTTKELPLLLTEAETYQFQTDQFEVSDLSYLEEESPWFGETSVSLMADNATIKLNALLTNTYRNAQPSVVATDDGIFAAFLRANTSNRTVGTYITKYNGEIWSSPVAVSNTAVFHGTPQLYVNSDGAIWLVYTETASDYVETSLLSFAKKQSIVAGTIDPTTLEFTELVNFSDGNYVHSPTLLADGSFPILAWVSSTVNSDQDVLEPTNNIIWYAPILDSGIVYGVGAIETSSPILSLILAEIDRNTTFIYQLKENDQINLYTYTVGKGTRTIADNVSGKVCFGDVPDLDNDVIYWNTEGGITTQYGDELAVSGISKEYVVLGDSIYYSAADENGTNLMVMQYTEDGWTLPMQLSNEERYLENLSVVQYSGNDFVVGMHTLAVIENDKVTDKKNLVWAKVLPVNDLKLDDVTYDANGIYAGKAIPLTLHVTNAGDHTVKNLSVYQNGKLLKTVSCSLAPSEMLEYTISVTCPDNSTEFVFSVQEPNQTDYNPDDNIVNLSLGQADLDVNAEYYQIGNYRSVMVSVINDGVDTASGSIFFYSESGIPLAECPFENLDSDGIIVADLELDAKLLSEGDFDILIEVFCEYDELSTHNNSTSIHIPPVSFETQILSTEQKFYSVFATVTLEQQVQATGYFATYNEKKKLLTIEEISMEAGINELTFSVSHSDATLGKLFVLDDRGVPLCEMASVHLK